MSWGTDCEEAALCRGQAASDTRWHACPGSLHHNAHLTQPVHGLPMLYLFIHKRHVLAHALNTASQASSILTDTKLEVQTLRHSMVILET